MNRIFLTILLFICSSVLIAQTSDNEEDKKKLLNTNETQTNTSNEEKNLATQRKNEIYQNTIQREIELIDKQLNTINESLKNASDLSAQEVSDFKQKTLNLQNRKNQLNKNLSDTGLRIINDKDVPISPNMQKESLQKLIEQ